ncbi:amino acid ABC transporter permease [Dictyobacter arantiisoli]|uniref:Glutamine ABC transporter permease n=1 Tax=Dictyobacter arantiisoli TaxID=2014874 RepID=A0A5A5T8H9_9CHLR|nr:amino acid ABC transporter permease [Dictyobacter arantiisoli]GCF07781.1 glutamine ABC transporter permease [Dictyobacter arantiisoli]
MSLDLHYKQEKPPDIARKRNLWPRNRMVGANYLYYILLAAVIGAFGYYLYTYRDLSLLYLPEMIRGALVTLLVSVLSGICAIIFGLLGAFGSLARFRPLRWLTGIYVEVIRGTPLLVQLYLWYYGIRLLLSNIGFDPHDMLFNSMTVLQSNSLVPDSFNIFFYGILGLSFNYGAYLTEVFRTGILSVERGQSEAALSLGLDERQTMRYIILPQAIRSIIPPLTNNFITLIQDSAFLSVIAVIELEYITIGFALPQADSNQKMYVFVLGALLYLVMCYPLSVAARMMERRLTPDHA